jgi:retinol dehydrogenase-12
MMCWKPASQCMGMATAALHDGSRTASGHGLHFTSPATAVVSFVRRARSGPIRPFRSGTAGAFVATNASREQSRVGTTLEEIGRPAVASASDPAIGDLNGKTFLVTGANTGIGRETALALAEHGARVFVASRSEQKTRPLIDEIVARAGNSAVEFLHLDLGDLASVRMCASGFLRTGAPLHGLINNAGLAGQRGMTESGFELAFGTNYVGPFLLTGLLLGRLRESAPSRIVNVSSVAHYRAPGIDYEAVRQPTKSLTAFAEYCVSKLGNVLHAQELARRLAGTGVTTYSLHPGGVASDVWRRVPWPVRPLITRRMLSPAQGARTSLYCATSPDVAAESGDYYDNCHRKEPSAVATPQLGAELWERSVGWVELRDE